MARGGEKLVEVPAFHEESDDERAGRTLDEPTRQPAPRTRRERGSSRDMLHNMDLRMGRAKLAIAGSQEAMVELANDFKKLVAGKEELLAKIRRLEYSTGEIQGEVKGALHESEDLQRKNEALEALVAVVRA
ncbi:AB hydrolase-1 domain-containing protein [Psidium guajava]|nr:AB hydrolase-1 domain-containing protein [Psidium guajava]